MMSDVSTHQKKVMRASPQPSLLHKNSRHVAFQSAATADRGFVGGAAAKESATDESSDTTTNRRLTFSSTVSLEVDNLHSFAESVTQAVENGGGFVSKSSINGSSSSVVFRVKASH